MKQLLSKILDRIDDFLDDTKESLSETTRLTVDKIRNIEIHKVGGTARRLRSLPLQYLMHPYFNFAMGVVLFIGLAIAGITADNSMAIWTLWLPMPLLALIVLSGWPDFRVVRKGIPLGLASFVVLFSIYWRLKIGREGPIPHLGIREIQDFFLAFLAGLAIWITAGRQTIGVYASWLLALGVVFAARLGLSETHVLFRPDSLPIIISLLWGFAALGGAIGHRSDDPSRLRRGGSSVVPAHLLAAGFGAALGWICVKFYLTTPDATQRDMAGAIERGRETIELIWTKSVLFGWGKDVSTRLAEVFAEPMTIEIPDWQGIQGTMAAYGVSSLFMGGLVTLALMWHAGRRAQFYSLSLSSAPQLALLAAQTFIWLILVGCPESVLPWLILGCWIGLGLASGSYARYQADSSSPFEDEEEFTQVGMTARLGFVGVVELAVIIGCFIALRPTLGNHWISNITPEDLIDPKLAGRIERARSVAPWNPEVEVKEAQRVREHLQTISVANWNEELFQRANSAYYRAHQADPYDPLITLQHAKLLDLAERPEEAQRIVLAALEITPSSETLVEWLYYHANRRRYDELALEMIHWGIRLQPRQSKWWQRLYSIEALEGRGSRAGHALGTALTGEPENKLLVQAAHRRTGEVSR